jgi:glycosyltransferase involved in cell wall biosynthesis
VTRPVLSVVVIGRNEGARLEGCLQSIRRMNFVDVFELIYVDSASVDGSPARAASTGAKVIEVQPTRPTAALGRNAGWRAASAPFVLFLDGDTILHPDFVSEALRQFDETTAIVWGHRREIDPGRSIYNRTLDLDWIYPAGIADFCGGDALMRRAVLAQVNGFDETLIAGEEPEMCRRIRALGWIIRHVDLPMTGHDLAMTKWSQYWRRATRAGYAYAEVSERFRGSGMPFWEEDARRNRNRAIVLIALCVVGLTGAWQALIVCAFFSLLVVRTAAKARWKSPSSVTRLLYGLHSHFQQIPIFIGQLQFGRDKRAGRLRGLIEYKGVSQ